MPRFVPFQQDLDSPLGLALLALCLVPLVPLLLHGWQAYRQRQSLRERFDAWAQGKGLSRAQGRLLWRLARGRGGKDLLGVLRSLTAFDGIVGGYAARQGERVQLRDFFRWDTCFPIVLYAGARQDAAGRWDLKQAARVEGTMLNLSGGGLCLRLKEAPPETLQGPLVVDPQFRGPFPLAGLVCGVVSGEGCALRLRFVDLPAHREAAIIRAIYRRQVGLWDEAQAAPLRRREQRRAVP